MLYQFNCKHCGALLEAELARDAMDVVCPICNETFSAEDLLTKDELDLLPDHISRSDPEDDGVPDPETLPEDPSTSPQTAEQPSPPPRHTSPPGPADETNTAADEALALLEQLEASTLPQTAPPTSRETPPQEDAHSHPAPSAPPEADTPSFTVSEPEDAQPPSIPAPEEENTSPPREESPMGIPHDDEPPQPIPSSEGPDEPFQPETISEALEAPSLPAGAPAIQAPGEEVFGNYALISQVGVSDVAVTYRARHLPTGTVVALKVLLGNSPWAGEEAARIVSNLQDTPLQELNHPNIAKVFEVGETDGIPFIATEFVEGKPLSSFLGTDISQSEVLSIVEAVAEGLSEAHKNGIVHGDIKPSNIIVDSYGNPLLVDFGFFRNPDAITKAGIGDAVSARRNGYEFPFYTAPEQIDGGECYSESDIYSLGAVVYHFVTGRPPLTSDNLVRLCLKIRDEPPPPPRLLNPTVSSALQAVILKCLAKRPRDRYHDCESIRSDIHRVMVGEPVQAEKKTGAGRAAGALLRTAALGILTAAGVGAYWSADNAARRFLAQRDRPPAAISSAMSFLRQGDADKAAATLSAALPDLLRLPEKQRGKYLPGVYYLLGRVVEHSGDAEEAFRRYRQALAVQPAHAPSLEAAGRILYLQHRYKEAEKLFRKLLEIKADAASRTYLALSLWGQGKTEEARKLLVSAGTPEAKSYLSRLDGDTGGK